MGRVEHGSGITKSPELIDKLNDLRLSQHWSIYHLAQEAQVSETSAYRAFNLKDPKSVSEKLFIKLVETLTPDSEQRVQVFELAGVNISHTFVAGTLAYRVTKAVEGLGLNSVYQALLEESTMAHVLAQGRLIRHMQSMDEQLHALREQVQDLTDAQQQKRARHIRRVS